VPGAGKRPTQHSHNLPLMHQSARPRGTFRGPVKFVVNYKRKTVN